MSQPAQASQPHRHLRPWSPSYGQDVPGASDGGSGSGSGGNDHRGGGYEDYGYGQAAGSYTRPGTVDPSDADGDDEMTNVDEDEEQERDADDSYDDEMTNADDVSTVGSMTNTDSATNFDAATNADTDDTDDSMSNDGDMYSTRTETVHSSILDHEFEGGRRYHHYRGGRYPLPNDDVEQNREISKHWVHMELSDGKLFNSPIQEYPQRIMDLCTGTGQWPIAAAEEYPSAEVVGVDLSPIQPLIIPPNLHFILDDVEDEWLDRGGYDLIHMRFAAMYIRDMPKLLRNIYDHLKPGGWVEFAEFGFTVFCDDETMPKNYGFATFTRLGHQAFLDFGMNPDAPEELGDELHRASFINIDSKCIPTPIGEWPDDPKQKAIGASFRDNLLELVNASPKILGCTGLDDDEIEVFLVSVRKSLYDSDVHSHLMFRSWWGQKPEEAS